MPTLLYNLYFVTEIAEEALNIPDLDEEPTKPPQDEICLLSSPSIILSLEMEIGTETIPVLVMQASLNGQVKDWSSDVSNAIAKLKKN